MKSHKRAGMEGGGLKVKVQPCCVQSNHEQPVQNSTTFAPGGGKSVTERSKGRIGYREEKKELKNGFR